MATYTVTSLEELAKIFDDYAKADKASMERATAAKHKNYYEARINAFQTVVYIIRNTEIVP